ncbi:unnamed protein product [Lota lota]
MWCHQIGLTGHFPCSEPSPGVRPGSTPGLTPGPHRVHNGPHRVFTLSVARLQTQHLAMPLLGPEHCRPTAVRLGMMEGIPGSNRGGVKGIQFDGIMHC